MSNRGGDYEWFREQYAGVKVDYNLTADAVAATAVITAKSAKHRIYVQKILITYLTHADGKTIDFQDSANTPVVIARRLDDAEGDATFGGDFTEFDYGPEGTALTQGKNLDIVANTGNSGSVARIVIYAYQKLEGPVTMAEAATGG